MKIMRIGGEEEEVDSRWLSLTAREAYGGIKTLARRTFGSMDLPPVLMTRRRETSRLACGRAL